MLANKNDRAFNEEYEFFMKLNAPLVKDPECKASEKMVKPKACYISMEELSGRDGEVLCGHLYHALC